MSTSIEVAAQVSNGNQTSIVLSRDGRLYLSGNVNGTDPLIDLGPGTKDRVDQITFNLSQIRTVCDD